MSVSDSPKGPDPADRAALASCWAALGLRGEPVHSQYPASFYKNPARTLGPGTSLGQGAVVPAGWQLLQVRGADGSPGWLVFPAAP